MKLTPYLKVLTNSAEKNNEATAPLRANEVQKRIELEIAQADTNRAAREAEVANIASRYPLDIRSLLNAKNAHQLAERDYNMLKDTLNELFPPAAQ